MHIIPDRLMRGLPHALIALSSIMLASCASNPPAAPVGQQGVVVEPTGLEGYTGRLQVTVTDQNGTYLERATVDLRSLGRNIWRRTVTTDSLGMATIDAVPPQVELAVEHQYGNFAQQIAVAQSGGATEVRVTIQSYGEGQDVGSNPNLGVSGLN